MRNDLGFREAAHLLAHRLERLIEPGIAVGDIALCVPDQGNGAGAELWRGASDQRADLRRQERRVILLRHAKLVRAHELVLTHDDAAEKLSGVFGGADLREQRLDLAEAPFFGHAARVARDLFQRLDIGRDPGKPVRCVLLCLERGVVDLAVFRNLRRDSLDGAIPQRARSLRHGVQIPHKFGWISAGRQSFGDCHEQGSLMEMSVPFRRAKKPAKVPESNCIPPPARGSVVRPALPDEPGGGRGVSDPLPGPPPSRGREGN